MPCGGDPIGTWEFSNVCLSNAMQKSIYEETCPQSFYVITNLSVTGTFTIDNTQIAYSQSTLTMEMAYEIPKTCNPPVGEGCSGFETDLDKISNKNTEGNVTCTEENSMCKCHVTVTDIDPPISLNYSTDNNSLKIEELTIPFCIKQNEMVWKSFTPGIEYNIFKKI